VAELAAVGGIVEQIPLAEAFELAAAGVNSLAKKSLQ
jgi:hypothetical protein